MNMTRRQVLIGTAAGLAGGIVAAGREPSAAQKGSLTLTFMGLGVLVVKPTSPGSAKPAASSPRVHVLAVSTSGVPRHYARLRVDKKFLKSPPAGGTAIGNFVEWSLHDYDLSISGAVETMGVSVANAAPMPCPKPAGFESVDLLGNLARSAGKGSGRVMPESLTANPPGAVGARVTISAGQVRAQGATGGYLNRTWSLRFPDGSPVSTAAPHVMAEGIVLNAAVQPSVALVRQPFVNAAVPRVPPIELVSASSTDPIEVFVLNHASVEEAIKEPVPVKHFASYFDLLVEADRPVQRPIPHPVDSCDAGKFAGKTGFCPGALAFSE